jgi:hypothetical protein
VHKARRTLKYFPTSAEVYQIAEAMRAERQDLLDRARQHLRAHDGLEGRDRRRRLGSLRGASEGDRKASVQRLGALIRELESTAAAERPPVEDDGEPI